MTFDDVRKMALAWPEVEDGTSYGTRALKVRMKLLARLKEDGDSLVMPGVPQDEREMLVESQPKVFYFTDHYKDYPMVLIRLSKAKRSTVEPLLRRHWRSLASKAAGKEFDANSWALFRDCEPTGRANARPMINSAKQSILQRARR